MAFEYRVWAEPTKFNQTARKGLVGAKWTRGTFPTLEAAQAEAKRINEYNDKWSCEARAVPIGPVRTAYEVLMSEDDG